jgi:hypothetical protein
LILYPENALKKYIFAISICITLRDEMLLKCKDGDVYYILRHLVEIYHCVLESTAPSFGVEWN